MMTMPGGAYFPIDDPDAERIMDDIAIKTSLLHEGTPFYIQIADSPFCVQITGPMSLDENGPDELNQVADNLKTAIEKARPILLPEEIAYFDQFLSNLPKYQMPS